MVPPYVIIFSIIINTKKGPGWVPHSLRLNIVYQTKKFFDLIGKSLITWKIKNKYVFFTDHNQSLDVCFGCCHNLEGVKGKQRKGKFGLLRKQN